MRKMRVVVPPWAKRGYFLIFGADSHTMYYLGRELGEKMENLYPLPSVRDRPGKEDRVIGTFRSDEDHAPKVAREMIALMENYDSVQHWFETSDISVATGGVSSTVRIPRAPAVSRGGK